MTFQFDKLTIKAQEAVAAAQNLAASNGNPTVESIHLLSALLDEKDGIIRPTLDKIGVNRSNSSPKSAPSSTECRQHPEGRLHKSDRNFHRYSILPPTRCPR